jgi:hypothetical protein
MKPPAIILTPEQKAVRFVAQRHSEAGQATLFATAISRATGNVSDDLNDEGVPVVLNAVLNALVGAIGFYVAQAPEHARESLIDNLTLGLPSAVAAQVEVMKEQD